MNLLATGIILAAEEEASGTDLLLPVTEELIAGIIAFAIVFFFVWKFAGPALNETLENRQKAIKGELDAAEKTKAEAATLLDDYKNQLKGARGDANRIVEEARDTAEGTRAGILAKADTEAAEILNKARAEAATEKERALQEARSEVASFSLDLAEKVVGESLDRDAQRGLVDSYIADLDRMAE